MAVAAAAMLFASLCVYIAIPMITTWFPFEMNIKSKQNSQPSAAIVCWGPNTVGNEESRNVEIKNLQ